LPTSAIAVVDQGAVERAFIEACELDVAALKPGNVRHGQPANGMSAQDFIDSAQACAPAVCESGAPIGQRVLNAIRSTRRVVQCNTNLGIVLLAAPLCAAAQSDGGLPAALPGLLQAMDRNDAVQVYEAIRLAKPGGMGTVPENDIHSEPQSGLLEAMRSAAGRDSVARQYASGFADVLGWGVEHWRASQQSFGDATWAVSAMFIAWLARCPDSLVERKFGTATAQAVSRRAERIQSQFRAYSPGGGRLDDIRATLLQWDEELRAAGLNPGTTADLTVATVLAAKLIRAV
jgi:triphosphoribosyl-dephospho-CoA synthase